MYRLVTFEATNISGFKSGLGRKTFRLDLKKLLGKDIIVILGDNATGKSTFLSLIHPMHTPSDKKQRFVVEGKEGIIVREYLGDDGTTIITKAIYTPKKDDGHLSKLYFTLINGDKETELNPNGNVASYYALVDTYFGVNKDYIQFASYNDVVKGIVKMNDSERKLSVSSLVPNTNRFETAYNIINDKYRDLNNTLRNLSQKIIHLGDEDSLSRDLKRMDRELKEYKERRDELIRKASVFEGQIKELSGGKSVKDMKREFKTVNDRMDSYLSQLLQLKHAIMCICDKLSQKEVTDENFLKIADIQIRKIDHLNSKIRTARERMAEHTDERSQLRNKVSSIEAQLNEYEATLFSLHSQSVESLEELRSEMIDKIRGMVYPSVKDQYENLYYDDAKRFCEDLTMISSQIDIAYERFGELVNMWFRKELPEYDVLVQNVSLIKKDIDTKRRLRDQSYQNIMEYNSQAGLKDILEKRPASCTDDSCPFIAKALEWDIISVKLRDETVRQEQLIQGIESLELKLDDYYLQIQAIQYLPEIYRMIERCQAQFLRYFNISIDDIVSDLSHGQIPNVFDLDHMKQHLTILSEKNLYDQITKITLPKIESEIKLIRSSENNRKMILNASNNLRTERDAYLEKMDRLQSSITIETVMSEEYKRKLEAILKLQDMLHEYKNYSDEYDQMHLNAVKNNDALDKIFRLSEKMDAALAEANKLNGLMKEIAPIRDRVYYNLKQLAQLNLEKAVVDRDFLIISLMKRMVGPGKGIWKEAIDIYMQDINAIANELLLHMFNGNLSLNDFIIDDKRFIIPYTFNGTESPDISYASSSQQTTISNAISLAIISKLLDRYGILTFDEVDKDLSPINKEVFVKILATQMRYIGIQQCFVITHNPDYYENYYPAYICFPGGKAPKDSDVIYI